MYHRPKLLAMLSGYTVGLGVTGSIAAVKTVELAHELRRLGADIRAISSPSASSIIHPWSLEFATGQPVVTEITGAVEHVELFGHDGIADCLLIAPATANTIGKIVAAIDDTPVTTCATTAIGTGLPIILAPAMHEPMYDHPGVIENIDRLDDYGVSIVPPRIEEGKAKIAAEADIALEVVRAVTPSPLAGAEVVVTSGPTTERIDPVRVLTNRSSGRMGRAVAKGCYAAGASVTLIHDGPDVRYATVERVESGAEMREATLAAVDGADALISAAAISDFTVEEASEKRRSGTPFSLEFQPEPKLIDAVRTAQPDMPIVGFKLEPGADDDALVAAARETLDRVDLAFVVANDATVLGADEARVLLVRPDDVEEHAGPKASVGLSIATELAAKLDS